MLLAYWQSAVAAFISAGIVGKYCMSYLKGDLGTSVYLDALSRTHPQYKYEVNIIRPMNPRGIKLCLDLFDAFIQEPRLMDFISFARLQTGVVD